MADLTASLDHNEMLGEGFMGAGNLRAATKRYIVDLDTGIKLFLGGSALGSPIMSVNLNKGSRLLFSETE
jgi:hypothetical protein